MLKKIYDKCVEWAGHKFANSILGIISFLESFIFPIPTDAMIIPMVIAKRNKFLKISLIAIIFSVLGALVGCGGEPAKPERQIEGRWGNDDRWDKWLILEIGKDMSCAMTFWEGGEGENLSWDTCSLSVAPNEGELVADTDSESDYQLREAYVLEGSIEDEEVSLLARLFSDTYDGEEFLAVFEEGDSILDLDSGFMFERLEDPLELFTSLVMESDKEDLTAEMKSCAIDKFAAASPELQDAMMEIYRGRFRDGPFSLFGEALQLVGGLKDDCGLDM